MKRSHYQVLSVIFTLAFGSVASAEETLPSESITAVGQDVASVTNFCDTGTNPDRLFGILEGGDICISDALKNAVANPMERVALSAMASSYLAANQERVEKPLPLPLRVLGAMVADAVTDNLQSRYGSALPNGGALTVARNPPKNPRARANWAIAGLARAQAAGSCEAITVGLFQKFARDNNLSVAQRSEAQQVLRDFGMAYLHPDDSCLS